MGCGSGAEPADTGQPWTVCDPREMGAGQVRVKRVGCTSELPSGSEGRRGDLLVQNQHLSLVFRAPAEALSKHQIGGGTLIDVVPTGDQDRLIEAIPLVEGGWMSQVEMDWGQDAEGVWVQVSGTSMAVPGLDPVAGGQPVQVTWRLGTDSRILTLEGASALYLHPGRDHVRVGTGFYRSGQALLTDAAAVDDLGGAVILQDLSALAAGDWDPAQQALYAQPSAGSCAEGAIVQALDVDGEVVAWMPPVWDTLLPASAQSLRCAAVSEIWGPEQALGVQDLAPGVYGTWIPVGEGPRFFTVQGPLGEQVVGPGEVLEWPPGTHSLRIDAGPVWAPIDLQVEIKDGVGLFSTLDWVQVIAPQDHLLADFFRSPWPATTSRLEPMEDARLAAGQGISYAVQSAPEQVGRPYTTGEVSEVLRLRAGSVAQGPQGEVWSIGWSRTLNPGFGVPDTALLQDPQDLLAMAMAPLDAGRLGVVDADWVAQAGPAWSWEPAPTALRLRDLQDLPVLLALAEQGERISVVGPLTWLEAPDTELPSAAQLERALVMGRSVATTGPWLKLELPPERGVDGGILELDCQGAERVQLITAEERLDLPCAPARVVLPPGWVVAVVDEAQWAVHAPVWI